MIGGFFAAIATIVFVSLIAAFAAAGISLAAAGVYTLVVSFGLLSAGHAALFFAQWGMAFAVFALAMLAEVLTVALGKALSGMWKRLTGRPIDKKPGKKAMRRTLIAGCAMLLGGLLVFTAAFGALGFDYQDLAVAEGLAVHEEELPVTDAFALEGDNVSLTVKRSEDETCKLVYRDFPESPQEVSFIDGRAVLGSKGGAFTAFGATLSLQWNRGLLIGTVAGELQRAELYLPASFLGDLDVQVENGAISIADMVCSDLVMKTNNGAVELSNVTAETVTAETKNGAIGCKNVACTRIRATASTGAVTLSGLRADFISLHTSTGTVKGTIAGSEADYTVEAEVSTGSCNLRDRDGGEKRLEVRVSTGTVRIKFLG